MIFEESLHCAEPWRELSPEAFCPIAADGQSAAPLRTVKRKGADNRLPASAHCRSHRSCVCFAIFGLDKEMKHGPVMPNVEDRDGSPTRHIRHKPLHPLGA